jgi:hypothetical protein
LERKIRMNPDRQGEGLFKLETVFSKTQPTSIDTFTLGLKQGLSVGFKLEDMKVTGLRVFSWLTGFLAVVLYMNFIVD